MKKITDYAELVKAKHALNKTIAPVEDGANIAGSYTSGKQFIREGVLYTALTTIAANTAWSSLTLDTDYELADDLTSQLASLNQTLTNNVSNINTALGNEVATRAKVSGHNLLDTSDYIIQDSLTGLTITRDSDGVFTLNGTTSTAGAIIFKRTTGASLQKLNGMVMNLATSGALPSGSIFRVVMRYTPWTYYGSTSGDDATISGIPNDSTAVDIDIYLPAGTYNNITVKPMIRLATDANSDYQPYSMTNQELTPIAQAVSNRNLLDNPWFTVNQRGQSSYSGTAGYSYDRWYRQQSGITVSLDSDECIVIQNTDSGYSNFKQPFSAEFIKAINGRTLTLSVLFKDGTITSNTSQNVDLSQNASYCSIRLADGSNANIRSTDISNVSLQIAVKGSSTIPAIRAFKLELGSVSTLAQDTAPNYATELLKCQRYFIRYISPDFFEGYTYDATTARFGLVLPVPMRTNPSFSVDDITHLQVIGNGSGQALTTSQTISNSGFGTNKKVMEISGLATALSANIPVFVKLNSGYIDLSADL